MRISTIHEFVELAEKLNFSNASKKLHVSQSTLSKHIAALEEDLGVRLFERNQHSVSLTAQGEFFLESARTIDSTYTNAKNMFRNSSRDSNRLLISGLIDSPDEFSLLVQASSIVQQACPEFTLNFIPAGNLSFLTMLSNKTIDCTIASFNLDQVSERERQELDFISIGRMPFFAIVADTHPLANKTTISLGDLNNQSLIRLSGPRFNYGWHKIKSLLDHHDISFSEILHSAISINDYLSVNLEENIFILPKIEMRTNELGHPHRRVIPIEDSNAYFDYGLLYRKDSDKVQLISRLAQAIRKSIVDNNWDENLITA